MRLLRAFLLSALFTSIASAAILPGRLGLGFFSKPSGGGQTQVFSYPSGFTGSHTAFVLPNGDSSFVDPNIQVLNSGTHVAGAAWYGTKETISSFTTEFTFQITNGGFGFGLVIQNDPSGTGASADANGIGYGTYTYNVPDNSIHDSVTVLFNSTPNSQYYIGATASVVGLYMDGGPYVNNGFMPSQDLTPQSINLSSGDLMDALVTYDGTILRLVVTDTVSGAVAFYSWPVNIPSIVGASTAYVGFVGGCVGSPSCGPETLNTWTWDNGYNTELSAPTFSPAPGQYSSSQTVTISGPAGATIYYTTNGKPPTTTSSVYSTPLTVSANEAIQAIAVESNYTNSTIGVGNYQIQASGPVINFPSGFSGTGLIQTAGDSAISGANIVLTDGAHNGELGSAFYVAPVSVSSFSTSFTLDDTPGASNEHNGITFLIMNPGPGTFSSVTEGLTSAPSSGAPSVTMSSAWAGALCTNCTLNLMFSDGETRIGTFNYNSQTVSLNTPLTNSVAAYFVIIRTSNSSVSGPPYTISGGNSQGLPFGSEGIGQSVGLMINPWGNQVGLSINGSPIPSAISVSGVTLGLNPDLVTITYSGTTLSMSIKDTVTSVTVGPYTWTVDIPTDVGASTAYVGFTGGAYDATSALEITNWTM